MAAFAPHPAMATAGPPPSRPLVAESWQRSASAGANPSGGRPPPIRMARDELADYRPRHPLAALLPLFRRLLGASAADDGHVFAICDADGMLLWVEGDTAALSRAERIRFVEGAVWTEAQAGTNAPGTALAVGRPVQIRGSEHFSAAVHPWSCAAAPIRDPADGRLLGVIDITGDRGVGTPMALALVRATALAAEGELGRHAAGATAAAPVVRLKALGRDRAVVETDGQIRRLSPRHSEIVVALALAGGGMTGERLAVDLSELDLGSSTVRAELTRLRTVLGPGVLGSRPYALLPPVRSDFGAVLALLAEGRVDRAMALYAGPLLPSSQAPTVVEHRRALKQQLRGAVLADGDPALLRRWVDTCWGADDATAWLTLAHRLTDGSPQQAAAAARALALDAQQAVGPLAGPVAALLQRGRF
ncbi:GAF domain-containing protein [Actinacidiphila alni]|uniref:GAF domain-containing protein n=1 Tax=Actinacidiphila alni TaxID=380248 RepID=UPI0033C833DD